MKKIISLIIIMLVVLSVSAIAQDAEPELTNEGAENAADASEVKAGIGPDSLIYGLDLALERIRLSLTFSKKRKAELNMKYAEERLSEIQEMHKKGKSEKAKRAVEAQEKNFEGAEKALSALEAKGEDISEQGKKLIALKAKNVEVLTALLEKVPEQAKEAIQNAITRSQEKRETSAVKPVEDGAQALPPAKEDKLPPAAEDKKPKVKADEAELETKEDEQAEAQEAENLPEVEETAEVVKKADLPDAKESLPTAKEAQMEAAEADNTLAGAIAAGNHQRCRSIIDGRVVVWYILGDEARLEYLGTPKQHKVYKDGEVFNWGGNLGEKAKLTDLPIADSGLETFNQIASTAEDVDCSASTWSEGLLLNPPLYVKFTDLSKSAEE